MPLDQQVRLGAGLLVLLGLVLAATVNRWFLAIPAFVGCGLTLSGLTGFCGMGYILMKMPWNQGSGAAPSCCTR
jgi:hypothetical protein